MYLTTQSHSPPPDSGAWTGRESRYYVFQDMSDVEQHGSTLNGGVGGVSALAISLEVEAYYELTFFGGFLRAYAFVI